jgi:hypothetical protein
VPLPRAALRLALGWSPGRPSAYDQDSMCHTTGFAEALRVLCSVGTYNLLTCNILRMFLPKPCFQAGFHPQKVMVNAEAAGRNRGIS